MFSFEFISFPSSFSLEQNHIEEIFSLLSKHVDIPQQGRIHIAFLSDTEIQTLNRDYRGIDKTTDVLSFHYFEDFSLLKTDEVAGEIILSESKILSQAEEYGHSPTQECEILIIHSLLHLLGHDHEDDADFEEMWKYEHILREAMNLSVKR